MAAAGWRNLAAELGIRGNAVLPLELLVMNQPDKVVGSANYVGKPALAHQNYNHPALLAAIRSGTGVTTLPDRFTVCGGPFTTEAVRLLAAERSAPETIPGAKP
jgi:iron complex transport system substrate-binding protein